MLPLACPRGSGRLGLLQSDSLMAACSTGPHRPGTEAYTDGPCTTTKEQ